MTIRKPPGKRLASLLLSLTLLLTLVPAMGTTASAANAAPSADHVFVDGNKCFREESTGHYESLYYKNNDEAYNFTGTASDYNAHYAPTTGILTLNNYNGETISVGGTAKADIIIELVGENIVNGSVSCDMGGDITIKGSGSLKVTNAENGNGDVCGIAAGYGNLPTGNVTIAGSANVTINAANHYNGSRLAYGIFARQSITISDSASVDITCSAPNSTASRSSCYGMYVSPSTSGGRVTIDTAGEIHIDVSEAGSNDPWSYGVSAPNYALTKVGSMEVQWADGVTSKGVPFFGSASFSTPHAVNVDTTNRYASYRSGTPYKVTVTGGYLTGPGVKYERNSGYFLTGDTVNLTAPDRQASSTDTTKIPFDKWVSNDVTITNGSSQAASFTMPSKDVAVRANYNPFATRPSFIKDSSYAGKGTIPLKLISENFDSTGGGINIYRASDLTKVNSSYIRSGTQITITVFETYCPKGEYVVGVSYGGAMCYSEPFTVKYTTPSASVAAVTVNGSAGAAITDTTVTVTLASDAFASTLSGNWITNLPAGLNQLVTRTNDTTATITITGTPQVGSTEDMKITIPAGALAEEKETSVNVFVNSKAKFNITSNAPTAENIQIGDDSNNKFSTDKLYYKNGENGAKGTFSNDSSNWNAYYNPATGTLTLKGYNGPYIGINGDASGDASQTVIVKLAGGTNNTVTGNNVPAIQLSGGVNLIVTADADANLNLTGGTNRCAIGPGGGDTQRNEAGSVTISGSANVTINASAEQYITAYGILSGKDVTIEKNASLSVMCTKAEAANVTAYGIMASGKVTVDTTGMVDINVSKCGNGGLCISASKIAFKNAEAITLKYIPSIGGWGNASYPTTPSASLTDKFDASGMKSSTTPTDVVANQLTTVTYVPKGAPPAKPTITLSSNIITDITNTEISVTLKHTATDVEIYYTTDGSIPTTDSTKYTTTFPVTRSCTVKAVAYSPEDQQYSDVVEQVLKWKALDITRVGGKAYSDVERNIEIYNAEPGTTVYLKAEQTRIKDSAKQIFSCWESSLKTSAPITNSESNVGAYFIMPYSKITVTAKYVNAPDGVTVSGTVKSYGSASEAVTVTLTPTSGTPLTTTVTGNSATYSFAAVPTGTYTLKVEKKGHAPWTESISVGGAAITKDVTIYLYGDINGDGFVKANDKTILARYLADWPGYETLPVYPAVADLNCDGSVKANDKTILARYLADWPEYETLPKV